MCCRPVPADHRYLSRTEAQLIKLPGKKFEFSEKQKQVEILRLLVSPAVFCHEKGLCLVMHPVRHPAD